MNSSLIKEESTASMDAAQLVVEARKAHEQKRFKECLGILHRLLLQDPGNSEAQALRAAILAAVERDLSDARALLADSQSRSEGHKYRKAAEIILLKILNIDPTHSDAKTLLATARATADPVKPVQTVQTAQPVPPEPVQQAPVAPAPVAPAPVAQAPVAQAPSPVVETPKPKPSAPSMADDMRFTAQPTRVAKPKAKKSAIERKLPAIITGFILLAGGGLFFSRAHSDKTQTAEAASTAPAPESPRVSTDVPATTSDSASPHTAAATPADSNSASAAAGPLAPVVPAPGSLTVSSSAPAEIYLAGKLLGQTPATLQLPAGSQTLEYRHGDLRTTVTHDIKSKETTNVMVNFDVIVQINARPWAQVFVEGTARKALGQTPLSSVRVPLGSVLTFENPNFPSKSYQVTDKDSSIQVVFP